MIPNLIAQLVIFLAGKAVIITEPVKKMIASSEHGEENLENMAFPGATEDGGYHRNVKSLRV